MDKKESGGKYNRRAHSVCCLIYHAVFVIKYRRKVIDAEIMEFMKNRNAEGARSAMRRTDLMEK